MKNPRWNFWQAFYVIFLIYIIKYFFGWLKAPSSLGNLKGYVDYLLIGFGEGALCLFALFLFLKIKSSSPRDLGLTGLTIKKFLIGLTGGVVLFFLVGLLGNLLVSYLGEPKPQSFGLVVAGASSVWQLIPLFVLGGIVVPLKEEILFRGLIFPPLRHSYGRGYGILLTALFFGVLHLDLIRFLPLFFGGLILTWLYEKTKSLWTPIIAHGTWNTLMLILMWLQRG